MSTLYLHIGTPKTGTSAIQYFLHENKIRLEKLGYYFPDFSDIHPEFTMKRNAHFMIYGVYYEELTDEVKKKVEEAYERMLQLLDEKPNVIVTEERIWHACLKIENFWEKLCCRLKERGHDLKVITYLRRQDEFIQSYWKFKVLSQEKRKFQQYVNSTMYQFFPLDYEKHLDYISNIVGKENMIVRVYEKQQYCGEEQSLISDFLSIFNIKMDDSYQLANVVRNTNVDEVCTEIKRILNRKEEFCRSDILLRKYMTLVSQQHAEEGKYKVSSLFEPSAQDTFNKKYEESNRQVAIKYLGREDGKLFYDPVKYRKKGEKGEFSYNEIMDVCGEIFHEMQSVIQAQKEEILAQKQEIKLYKNRQSVRLVNKINKLLGR